LSITDVLKQTCCSFSFVNTLKISELLAEGVGKTALCVCLLFSEHGFFCSLGDASSARSYDVTKPARLYERKWRWDVMWKSEYGMMEP